jgi:hypothetical protein
MAVELAGDRPIVDLLEILKLKSIIGQANSRHITLGENQIGIKRADGGQENASASAWTDDFPFGSGGWRLVLLPRFISNHGKAAETQE